METQNTLDAIEKSLDAVEVTLDAAVPEVVETVNTVKNNPVLLVGIGLVGLSIGLAVGYKIAEKRLSMKFEERLDREVEDAKTFYAAYNKADEFSTPETALKALHPEEAVKVKSAAVSAAEAVKKYAGQEVNVVTATHTLNTVDDVETDETEISVEETKTTTNIFLNGEEVTSDYDVDAALAERIKDRPYVITKDMFFENVSDAEVDNLTWYDKDQVLVADDDELSPIVDTDTYVGDHNLEKFGEGSEEANTVYVRNDVKGHIYEIVRSRGSYAKEVLGFDDEEEELQHSSSYKGGGRKFRSDDD